MSGVPARTMLRAMGRPMCPSPMNPTLMHASCDSHVLTFGPVPCSSVPRCPGCGRARIRPAVAGLAPPRSRPGQSTPAALPVVLDDLAQDAGDRVAVDLVVLVDLDRPGGQVVVPLVDDAG